MSNLNRQFLFKFIELCENKIIFMENKNYSDRNKKSPA